MTAVQSAKSVLASLLLLSLLIALDSSAGTRAEDPPLTITVMSPMKFNVSQDGRAVRAHAFALRNVGKADLKWQASSNQAWLRFDPPSGSLSPNATASIDSIADPEGFAPGLYVATAQIAGPNVTPRVLELTMAEHSAFPANALANAERTFPLDSGMVNVKTVFGAKGDGTTDDTQAIQQAISSTVHHQRSGPRILYFPAGIYVVSRPLLEKDLDGQWNSLLTLQGENRATTIVRLTDNNALYQSASTPRDVLHLASQNGGTHGGGNSAFDNNVFDMTIDVGRGNPGAVAVDFMGNNYCALRNVTLQSSDSNHAGVIGLAILRYASGPCLLKNVVINGFDYGIRVGNSEYSITAEHLTLLHQKLYGIYNASNVLSIRHLFSANSVPAICNVNAAGLVTLIGGVLQDGSPKYSAIQNSGTLYARDVRSSGYASVLEALPGSSIAEYDSGPAVTQFGGKPSSLNLPVEETPHFEDMDLGNWKSVTAFGADPTGRVDSSAAIQKAIDSGATTVYFPTGIYLAARTILVRGNVRMLQGFDSSLNPAGEVFARAENPAPLFKIEAGTADVTLNHLRIGAFYPNPVPGVLFIQQNSARPLVLRDSIVGSHATTLAHQTTSLGTGPVFVENVAAQPWQILFPQNFYARQINPESNTTKIINRGGKLWILGLKTEGTGTNVVTEQAGETELLGGLFYPVWMTASNTADLVVKDSRASFIYAVSSYKTGTNFAVQVRDTQGGVMKSLLSTSLPARGLGTMVPLYSSGDLSSDAKKPPGDPAVTH